MVKFDVLTHEIHNSGLKMQTKLIIAMFDRAMLPGNISKITSGFSSLTLGLGK